MNTFEHALAETLSELVKNGMRGEELKNAAVDLAAAWKAGLEEVNLPSSNTLSVLNAPR
jgi:hypothetical protein